METNKTTPSKNFNELFDVILNGNKKESREAAREMRKLVYGSWHDKKYDDIGKIINNAPDEYREILEDWREENFVMAVSVLYFLHDKEKTPDFLFPWLFYLLQHKNGNIRLAAFRMIENELGPLTVHIRCPEYKYNEIEKEQADFILLNLFITLNNLLVDWWQPKYKKYKYIASFPACPYKSIQMVLSTLEYFCGKKYIRHLLKKAGVKRG